MIPELINFVSRGITVHSNLFPVNTFRHNLIKIKLTGPSLYCSVLITVFGQYTFLIPVLEQQSSKTTHINHCCAPGLSGGVGTSWITFQASVPFYIWVFLFSQLSIRNDANGQFRSCFRLICLDKTKVKPVAPSCVTLRYVPFRSTVYLKHKACEQIISIVWRQHKLDIWILLNNEDI